VGTQSDEFDVRGLSLLTDLTGDGAADLIWKHHSTQFDCRPSIHISSCENSCSGALGDTCFDEPQTCCPHVPRWDGVEDDDALELYPSNGEQFQFPGGTPQGLRLDGQTPYLSRSYVDARAWLESAPSFMTDGTRRSMARLLDYDDDGRPDLLAARFLKRGWESPARLMINAGAAFLPAASLGAIEPFLAQETEAFYAEYGDWQRPYLWASTKDLADLDGDGLPESWAFGVVAGNTHFPDGTLTYARDSDRQPLRLLKQIDNGPVARSRSPTPRRQTTSRSRRMRISGRRSRAPSG
jgi:hypothetical protein